MSIQERKTCRICGSSDLLSILNLGDQYLASYTPKSNDVKPTYEKFPLELVRCDTSKNPQNCGLVQLRHTTPSNLMYERYFYRSGINQTMIDNLNSIVEQAKSKINLQENDFVIDIGCNDGTLLKNYKDLPVTAVGFDPAKNMVEFSIHSGAKIITDFFNANSFKSEFGNQKAKIITSIAMFYDLEDPNAFVYDISEILDIDGIWVLELSYLPLMLSENALDTIVHEHLEYYHFSVLEFLLSKHNLKVVDIHLNDINGGSFRVFVQHKTQSIDDESLHRIENIRINEKNLGLHTHKPFEEFLNRINSEKTKLVNFILNEKKIGKKIFGYGASTKGNTLLQFYGLNDKVIDAIADRNPDKWGRKTVGTNIPIISEKEAREKRPDYFLVLPWHFMKEFHQRETEYLNSGGKFIVPLPKFEIIS